jgi:hypothetical protein
MAGLLRASRRQNRKGHQTDGDPNGNGLHVASINGAASRFAAL